MACLGGPHLPDCEHVRWIETEEIRGPGADFGPALLIVGLVLFAALLVALL